MKVLVTGADGFVGSWLVPALLEEGHDVLVGVGPGAIRAPGRRALPEQTAVRRVPLDVEHEASVREALGESMDAVVHLAAVASGGDARRDPARAYLVNAAGTARVAEAMGRLRAEGAGDPLLLLASTAEVYGAGPARARTERDATLPVSPYGGSKLAAEVAALEVHRRTGLRVVVARAFPHTGAGQDDRFVIPAFARRLLEAKRTGDGTVAVGNLDPVRDFLHVSDVVGAYVRLLTCGETGAVYNVASGTGVALADVFALLRDMVGHHAEAARDPELARTADIPHLVGDGTKLRERCGWEPRVSLQEALTEVVHAQTD